MFPPLLLLTLKTWFTFGSPTVLPGTVSSVRDESIDLPPLHCLVFESGGSKTPETALLLKFNGSEHWQEAPSSAQRCSSAVALPSATTTRRTVRTKVRIV